MVRTPSPRVMTVLSNIVQQFFPPVNLESGNLLPLSSCRGAAFGVRQLAATLQNGRVGSKPTRFSNVFEKRRQAQAAALQMSDYNSPMAHILDQSAQQLQAWMLQHDQRPYRAAQIRKWIFEKRADCLGADDRPAPRIAGATGGRVQDLVGRNRRPPQGRRRHGETAPHPGRRPTRQQAFSECRPPRTGYDGTDELPPKGPLQIECVLLRDDKGHCSMCISTQVGCAMKCASAPRAWAA